MAGLLGRSTRRLPEEDQQLRRGDALRAWTSRPGAVSDVDVIEGAKYAGASWTPDGDGFYYTWLPVDPRIPAADRPGYAEVRFHRLGTDPKKDTVVQEKTGDPTVFQTRTLTRDGRLLFLATSHGWTSQDV